jgi:hypothetical protein
LHKLPWFKFLGGAQDKKPDGRENTDKKAYVEVEYHRPCQRQYIKPEFALVYQFMYSQYHKGQKRKGIKPHNITVIPQSKSA